MPRATTMHWPQTVIEPMRQYIVMNPYHQLENHQQVPTTDDGDVPGAPSVNYAGDRCYNTCTFVQRRLTTKWSASTHATLREDLTASETTNKRVCNFDFLKRSLQNLRISNINIHQLSGPFLWTHLSSSLLPSPSLFVSFIILVHILSTFYC